MLPLLLTLKNFMSYGEEPTTLDFRDMPVLCLSGDNGHGKSALLDAITWSLWGETRLGKQNHEQLIRLGAEEMLVQLEFGEGGETYRVRRQRSKRAGSQLWELQIQEAGGSWRPITGQGTGDTGRAIVQLLRMTYETFLNSAYLRQGRADEFVRQTANKRKEILAEILDLARYDELEDAARRHMKEASDRAVDAGRAIQQVDSELGLEDEHRSALRELEIELDRIEQTRAAAAKRSEELTEARALLLAQLNRVGDGRSRIVEVDRELARLDRSVQADSEAAAKAQKLLDDGDRIEAQRQLYEAAQGQIEPLQDAVKRLRDLEARRREIEQTVASELREREIARTAIAKERAEVSRLLEELPRARERSEVLEASVARHRNLSASRTTLWDGLKELEKRFAGLRVDHERATADLEAASTRLDNLAAQGEACSICGSPLTPDKLETIADECAVKIEELKAWRSGVKQKGIEAKAEIAGAEQQINEIDDQIKSLDKERDELSAVRQRRLELERLQNDRLPTLDADLNRLEEEIAAGSFSVELRGELAEILPQIAVVSGSQEALDRAMKEVRDLRWVEQAYAHLQNAARELDSARKRMEDSNRTIQTLREQRSSLSDALAEAPALDTQVEVNARDTDLIRSQLKALDEEGRRAHGSERLLQEKIEHCEKIRILRSERARELQKAQCDLDLYTMLAGSFGKRGVQALIIENALPELQDDANDLLDQITDGEMRVEVQTTRQAKSKAVSDAPIETLEVAISDHLGSRPLEMYSGGESFRVSFALRIALSKLLARRAGASLQTLIIDEGFGTQDAKGREKLVDAIMAIQGEFARIIVITHVDEMKDAFPNRIEVVKTPTGSEATVIHAAALG